MLHPAPFYNNPLRGCREHLLQQTLLNKVYGGCLISNSPTHHGTGWRRVILQGGVESQDALSLQVVFREKALDIVALLREMTCNLRHPMGLCHPVQQHLQKNRGSLEGVENNTAPCTLLQQPLMRVCMYVCVCMCVYVCVCNVYPRSRNTYPSFIAHRKLLVSILASISVCVCVCVCVCV